MFAKLSFDEHLLKSQTVAKFHNKTNCHSSRTTKNKLSFDQKARQFFLLTKKLYI